MAVTLPRFIWGGTVDATNAIIPFDRGGNLSATMRYGDYLPAELATEAARAMNAADTGQAYTCVFDFSTRKFTFDNGATAFALEWSRSASTNAAGLFGFDDADTASSAAGHESTSAVGAGFSTLKTWAPTDPVHMTTPVSAEADGTAATLLQRDVMVRQFRSDGGFRESIYYHTEKVLRLNFRWIVNTGSPTEQANMESLLDWLVQGKRFNYQPDATSTDALRLMLRDPGEINGEHEWLTRTEISYGTLTFVEALDRT